MKKLIASILCACTISSLLVGCGSTSDQADQAGDITAETQTDAESEESTESTGDAKTNADADHVINVWAFTDEVPGMIEKYKELHPDFDYDINTTIIATTDGAYQPALDQALASGGADAPDIYCAEAAFVLKYTQGDASQYAAAYEDLGIDVATMTKDADIAQYTMDIGTNPDGKLVALGYQATGGAFIYRRSIAKDVWGTDDPAEVQKKVADWDTFKATAEEQKLQRRLVPDGISSTMQQLN